MNYSQTVEQLAIEQAPKPMTPKEILAALSAPFPEEAITRVDAKSSGRGVPLTGIGRAWLIERLNEVVGIGNWNITEPEFEFKEVKYGTGTACQCICKYWLEIKGLGRAFGLGDGISRRQGDAMKGAETGAFKRAAACFGLGLSAFKGTLDEDMAAMSEPRELIQNKTANLTLPTGQVPPEKVAQMLAGPQQPVKDDFDF